MHLRRCYWSYCCVSTFIYHLDNGAECILSKLREDRRLGRRVAVADACAAAQRVFDKLEKRAGRGTPWKGFSKDECQVLSIPGEELAHAHTRTGWGHTGCKKQLQRKGLGVLVDKKLKTLREAHHQKTEGVGPHWWGHVCSAAYRSGLPSTRETETSWWGSSKGCRDDWQMDWSTFSVVRRLRELALFSQEQRELSVHLGWSDSGRGCREWLWSLGPWWSSTSSWMQYWATCSTLLWARQLD